MTRSLPSRLALAAALVLAVASDADAQLLDRIKKDAAKRIAAAKAKSDSAILAATGKAVDSTLSKANRPVTAGAQLVGNKYDGALNAGERTLKSQFGPSGPTKEQIVAMLESGRAVIPQIQFVVSTDQLEATAEKPLQALADALNSMEGIFLIEIYADSAKDGGAAAVAGAREVALKTRLVAAQMKGERFFVRASGTGSPARVEVVKAQ